MQTYSATTKRRLIPLEEMSLTRARREYELRELQVAEELRDLASEKQALEAELRVATATLQALRSIDPMKVELLEREYERARQAAATSSAALDAKHELLELGQASRRDVDQAELALRQAELSAEEAKIKWRLAAKQLDLPGIETAQIRIRELEIKLGLAESGGEGIDARLEALQAKVGRQRKQFSAEREKAERRLHEKLRDSFDHTPVVWVEVRRDDKVVRKIRFTPPGSPPAEGCEADTGAAYDPARGYGWEGDRTGFMAVREDRDPPGGVAVVRAAAIWRCRTGPGELTVTMRIGDSREWHGAIVRIQDDVAFVKNKLEENDYTDVVWRGTVANEALEIRFGGPHDKTLRAEIGGALADTPWTPGRGSRTRGWVRDWPVMHLTRPEKYYVKARVPRQYTGLLRPWQTPKQTASAETGGEGGEGESAPAGETTATGSLTVQAVRDLLAIDRVEVVTADGRGFDGTIREVGTEPVPLSFAPGAIWVLWQKKSSEQDKIAREIKIGLPAAAGAACRLDSRVSVVARLRVPTSVAWVPAYFVEKEGDDYFVHQVSSPDRLQIRGFRVGNAFVTNSGLRAGMRLAAPPVAAQTTAGKEAVFDGRVVPGTRTPVVVPEDVGGLIQDLTPDGEWVEEGDWVLTLYAPWWERRKKEEEEERKLAEQKFLQAAEERRLKAMAANLAHRVKVSAERQARAKVRSLSLLDPLAEVTARHAYERARLAYDDAAKVVNILQAGDFASAAELSMMHHKRGLAEVARDRQRLALVSAVHGRDWLTQASVQAEWDQAREALGIRDMVLNLARQEEEVARLKSRLDLEAALKGGRHQRLYEMRRVIRAPATGRLFYEQGYDFIKRRAEKFSKEMEAWEGITVAEVLDMGHLAFEAELPETFYHRLSAGTQATVVFAHLDGVSIAAQVRDIGRAFYVPRDAEGGEAGEQAVSSSKVFKAVFSFSPPREIQDRLTPGTKGQVMIP